MDKISTPRGFSGFRNFSSTVLAQLIISLVLLLALVDCAPEHYVSCEVDWEHEHSWVYKGPPHSLPKPDKI